MAINKVDFAGQTLIDLTKDTVTADKLLQGITAHDKAGNPIAGTASGPKPEQVKEITISENGDYPITPDVGKVLSKVLAKVNVSGGGGVGFDPAPFSRIEVKTLIPARDGKSLMTGIVGASLIVAVYNGPRDFIPGGLPQKFGAALVAPENSPFSDPDPDRMTYNLAVGTDVASGVATASYYENGYLSTHKYPFIAGKEYIFVGFFGPEV